MENQLRLHSLNKISVLIIFSVSLCSTSFSQSLPNIFTNVDTLFIPGAGPGHLSPLNQNVIPIVSNSECSNPLYNFAVANIYQNGKVIGIGHEGLLANNNINQYDNSIFLLNAIQWLDSINKKVTLKEGWINSNNSSILQTNLVSNGYTFNTLNGPITDSSLSNTDILILGNDWNNLQPYLNSEIAALDTFVTNGGSLLIAGLGWSWAQAQNLYPMNQVANLFGFDFSSNIIYDPNYNVNGAPKFYNFYPQNIDTTITPYCPSPYLGTNFRRGDTLRVLRLAISTTGEFTQQNGGTTAVSVLIDQWLDDINQIYGREYCVRFEVVPTNNLIIFPDSATDPWGTLPPGSLGCINASVILNDQANIIDSIIGSNNYDISHVIAGNPFSGGCAVLGGLKKGLSGGLNIPVTRHELGHQFSQSHTINHPNNDNYEPENGSWTIQGGNQHGYGHAVSFHQLANFLVNSIPNLGIKISTGNTIPTVSTGPDYTIPISTPFTLSSTANDLDLNDTITYIWDNMSPSTPQFIPVPDDSQGALFMRLVPDTNSSRTFPKLSDVVANNNSNSQEQLPTQARVMDFRLTVNDNHKMTHNSQLINASGINSADIHITVADSGPFEVTSQSTNGIIYTGGSNQLVAWNVNGTDSLPINTQNVKILLSTDGGYTYPIVLKQSTINNGFSMVTLPDLSTTTARIKVSAIDNIYFDINTNDFQIQSTFEINNTPNNTPISIYPNPTSDFFRVELGDDHPSFKVELFSINGQLLKSLLNTNTFDVTTIPNGVYIIVITEQEDKRNLVTKLIIKR